MARFFRRGITKFRFLPAVASATLEPTRAEMTSGTDISPDVADITGWELSNTTIPTPDLATRFVGSISGEDTVDDAGLVFYDDDATEVIRDLLAAGTVGYVMILPYGDVATKRAEVFPVRTTVVADEKSMGNDPARFRVGFAVTAKPNTDVTIPALTP